MASSIRLGRFKKKLVSEDELEREAPIIESKMIPFHDLLANKTISAAEFCGIYILSVLSHRYPFHFLGQKTAPQISSHNLHFKCENLDFPQHIQKKIKHLSIGDLLNHYSLRSTPSVVNRALLKWSLDEYPLVLMFRIPSAFEVLEQQKSGRRCVSVLTTKSISKKYILGERDALSFTMHDLIHADHFYHDNLCYEGQMGLYGLLHSYRDYFSPLFKNQKFYAEFEYLIADMNAYPIHALKCLKSAMIHHGSDLFFNNWIKDFPVKTELLKLNTQLYDPFIEDFKILNWLQDYRKN